MPRRKSIKEPTTKQVEEMSPFEMDDMDFQPQEPEYSDEESRARVWQLQEIENIRNTREAPQDEYNNLGYTDHYVENFKAGLSYRPPRKNKEDTSVVTGTTREKKLAIINSVVNLVFETTFRAFDEDDIEDQSLGEAMTDCVYQANKIEQWDEKKLYAYSELTDQGDVFIEDMWVDEKRVDKKKIKLSAVTEETFKNFVPSKSLKVMFSGPKRRIIPGPQVYLGNIREPDISQQPVIWTRYVIPYSVARAQFGHLPRFKNVPKDLVPTTDASDTDHFGLNWRLEKLSKGMVEVLCRQDKWNDDYQIYLNGVPQFPVGFPMPWEHGEYNLVKGSLEPISAFFAYSKSVPSKTYIEQQILDEMYRLAVLKTQKSFMPPIANYSANILTKNMFLPGKVNNNLEKGDVEVMGGNPNMYSMQQSEFEMIRMIKGFIDEKSVSPALQGQAFGSRTTATEVDQVMAQAKQQLGIMIFGFMNLHLKLDFLRLHILLENYTKDRGEKINKITGKLEKKFASVNIEREIAGRGIGNKRVEFTDTQQTPEEIYDREEGITRDEAGNIISQLPPNKPTKITQISPTVLRQVKYHWYPEVNINNRESSLAERISYEDRLMKAGQLFGMENINWEYAKRMWAVKNKIDPAYFFTSVSTPVPQQQVDGMVESPVNQQARSSPTGVGEAVKQGAGG